MCNISQRVGFTFLGLKPFEISDITFMICLNLHFFIFFKLQNCKRGSAFRGKIRPKFTEQDVIKKWPQCIKLMPGEIQKLW